MKVNKILFVDDEPRILDGIRRMMHPLRVEWDAQFVTSGPDALEILDKDRFDIIVTDMQMPAMTGAELLVEVQKRHPHMVRIALSGTANKESIMRAAGPVHQYLSKPCEPEELKHAVIRSMNLRDLLQSDDIKMVVSQTESLPSLPSLYMELTAELSKPEASIKEIEKIISKDLGMTTKILQLVNSAFFGVRRHIASPGEAVRLLGLDTIESLVLSVQVFSRFDEKTLGGISLQDIWDHSMTVSSCSKAIAKSMKADVTTADDTFIAGLLHDVGKLIVASRFPDKFREAVRIAKSDGMGSSEAEKKAIGATHAEIGAYLLGLWGFSDPIVEAVAYHHNPMAGYVRAFSPLTAVHVANSVMHETADGEADVPDDEMIPEYLAELGYTDLLPGWREICLEIISHGDDAK